MSFWAGNRQPDLATLTGGFLKSLLRPAKTSRVVRCMGHECACFVLIKSSAAPYRC